MSALVKHVEVCIERIDCPLAIVVDEQIVALAGGPWVHGGCIGADVENKFVGVDMVLRKEPADYDYQRVKVTMPGLPATCLSIDYPAYFF